ncbi:MAG: type II toxin-antitoxin system prevent-host-death family antitoxin [Candidatus Methylomirabilaceae bacterium]
MPTRFLDTRNVRERLGEVLDQAHYRGDEFVVQRRGRRLAAIIPYEAYEQFKRQRAEAMMVFRDIWNANAGADPREVEEDVRQAVEDVRSTKKRSRR